MITVHLRIVDASSRLPTPARLRITDGQGNHYMPFGRLATFSTGIGEQVGGHLQLGKELYTIIDGSCEISLPAGVPLRIQAAKGPEYRPLDRTVVLGAGQMALRFELTRWHDHAGWLTGDSRAHFLSPHDALLEAAAEGLDLVNLLARWHTMLAQDGNTYATLANLAAFSGTKPAIAADNRQVIVNTLNSHRALGGVSLLHAHRVVYPITYGEPEGTDDWSICDWCDQCHRKKGLTVWVDAFRANAGLLGGEVLVALLLGKIDAIEVDSLPRPQPLLHWLYHLWNAGFAIPLVGGSGKDDNRIPLGAMRTYARVVEPAAEPFPAWIEAVRAGRTFATTGPILNFEVVESEAVGATEQTQSGKSVQLRASVQSLQPFDKLEILLEGEVLTAVSAAPAPSDTSEIGPRYIASLERVQPISRSGWLAARCVGAHGTFARTHLQWLRA